MFLITWAKDIFLKKVHATLAALVPALSAMEKQESKLQYRIPVILFKLERNLLNSTQ